ncbi:MAG: TRAP transporter substrate-binding protein [Clostridiales bacterium]|nr:TRAP transporter substrate-binding protein [Clostridiales bacterium]
MKKTICMLLVSVLLFSLAACGGSNASAPPAATTPPASTTPATTTPSTPAPAAPATAWNPDNIRSQSFILGHGQGETSQVGAQYHEFALAVEELSGGKMKVEERIAGTLVTDTETLDAILDSVIDFAHSMGSYVTGLVTDLSPLTIAGYYGGDDWNSFADGIFDLVSDIYGDYNIKYVAPLYQGNSYIACTQRQIKVPGDVTGLTFRASGTWVSKTVDAWGGAAVTIGLADLADSFSKNAVQGVATGMNIIVPFKIYEVAKYITFTSISEGFAALLMSGDTWARLNADEQAVIMEAGKIFQRKAYDIAIENIGVYEDTINSEGKNEVYTLNAAEQKQFIERAYSVYNEMEGELGPKGLELIGILKRINGIG